MKLNIKVHEIIQESKNLNIIINHNNIKQLTFFFVNNFVTQ